MAAAGPRASRRSASARRPGATSPRTSGPWLTATRRTTSTICRPASLRAMAHRGGGIGERDAEVTFRFPVHPLVKGERQALEDAVRGSAYRFVHVEDTLVRNLGAGGGAGPYVIIDFVVPIIQHAGGDILGVAAIAGLTRALAALRRGHAQRIR